MTTDTAASGLSDERRLPDERFGKAWAAVELVAQGALTEARDEHLRWLVGHSSFDHGEAYLHSVLHRLTPLFSYHVQRIGVITRFPGRLQFELKQALHRQRCQYALLASEAERIAAALGEAGVEVACTKGVVFATTIYEDVGARSMNDIDFTARRTDADAIRGVMRGLGYMPGDFDWQSGETVPMDRALSLAYKLFPDNIPQLVRATGNGYCPCFLVDFSHTFTWSRSPWSVDLDRALHSATTAPLGDATPTLPVLDVPHQFVRLVCHIFREAWFQRWIADGQDVTLRKLADVLRFWQCYGDRVGVSAIRDLVLDCKLERPVAWVLGHVDRMCGTQLIDALGIAAYVDDAWLASARGGNYAHLGWHGDLRARLHDRRTVILAAPD